MRHFKQQFPCLVVGLKINPDQACVIIACAILHNMAKEFGEPEIDEELANDEVEVPLYAGPLQDGRL